VPISVPPPPPRPSLFFSFLFFPFVFLFYWFFQGSGFKMPGARCRGVFFPLMFRLSQHEQPSLLSLLVSLTATLLCPPPVKKCEWPSSSSLFSDGRVGCPWSSSPVSDLSRCLPLASPFGGVSLSSFPFFSRGRPLLCFPGVCGLRCWSFSP